MKIKLIHYTPYLPYKLKVERDGDIYELTAGEYEDGICIRNALDNQFKPILRFPSDLTKKELEELGLILVEGAGYRNYTKAAKQWLSNDVYKNYGTMKITISVAIVALNWCFKKHLDLFGLIERGLAIKKN